MESKEKDAGKLMRILMLFVLLLSVLVASAQADIDVEGSGKTGTITYGETVTGELQVSDASDIQSISYVGHNGQNRVQGDFDVWNVDVHKGDNLIVRLTATHRDFIPTLLITYSDTSSFNSIGSVVNLDLNVDGDSEAGVCLRDIP